MSTKNRRGNKRMNYTPTGPVGPRRLKRREGLKDRVRVLTPGGELKQEITTEEIFTQRGRALDEENRKKTPKEIMARAYRIFGKLSKLNYDENRKNRDDALALFEAGTARTQDYLKKHERSIDT